MQETRRNAERSHGILENSHAILLRYVQTYANKLAMFQQLIAFCFEWRLPGSHAWSDFSGSRVHTPFANESCASPICCKRADFILMTAYCAQVHFWRSDKPPSKFVVKICMNLCYIAIITLQVPFVENRLTVISPHLRLILLQRSARWQKRGENFSQNLFYLRSPPDFSTSLRSLNWIAVIFSWARLQLRSSDSKEGHFVQFPSPCKLHTLCTSSFGNPDQSFSFFPEWISTFWIHMIRYQANLSIIRFENVISKSFVITSVGWIDYQDRYSTEYTCLNLVERHSKKCLTIPWSSLWLEGLSNFITCHSMELAL